MVGQDLETTTRRTFRLNEVQQGELELAGKGYFHDFPPPGVIQDPLEILGIQPGERIGRKGYDLLRTTLIQDCY